MIPQIYTPPPEPVPQMTQAQRDEYLHRLVTDFEFFAQECLLVVPKKGGAPVPFIFNDAQKHLHREVERMRLEIGLVRIKGVKGRQQGFSTYVEGRFIWHAFRLRNVKVFILSHETLSTQNLFGKVKFFYENAPVFVKPGVVSDNRQEYKFTNGSEYKIATAGTEETGRSHTAQFMHRSERAFFKNVEQLDSGVGQIVSYEAGTEIIDESTGNGFNHYRTEVFDAVKGIGRYRHVFVPWYWQQEYREPVPAHFVRSEEEQRLVDTYGLEDSQLQWRRSTILELKSVRKFRQEYPCSLEEAFQASTEGFYNSDKVMAARKSKIKATSGAIIIGVDPAGPGDRTVIAVRRSVEFLALYVYEPHEKGDDMWLAGVVAKIIDYYRVRYNSVRCFIDAGYGHGTYSRLKERKYERFVEAIHFGGKSSNPIYLNKRVEMNFEFREWLDTVGPTIFDPDVPDGSICGVSIPDRDDVSVDIAALPESKVNSNSKHTLMSKEDIKKEYGQSTDILDAMILTFAYPVADDGESDFSSLYSTDNSQETPTSELATRRDMYNNGNGPRTTRFKKDNIVYGRGWTGNRIRTLRGGRSWLRCA